MMAFERNTMLIVGAALLAVGVPVVLLWPGHVRLMEPPLLIIPPMPNPSFALAGAASARPLFRTDRTPPSTDEGKAAASVEAPPADPPRLVGIVVRPGLGVALVVNVAGETVTAHVGDMIDGWQLNAVARDRVRFAREGATSEVVLDFTKKSRTAGSDEKPIAASGPVAQIPLPSSQSPLVSSLGPRK